MKINQAIAILRAGRSFSEAAEVTGLSVDEVIRAWNEREHN